MREVCASSISVEVRTLSGILRCKKAVTANKQFTVHDAPMVLTVHLKRFSPFGRKIGHPIRYDERLSLQSVMSEGQFGPTYTLFGIVSHAGGGPNSGHYFAHIKDSSGHWFEMNDESVVRTSSAPLSMKNAYILFYIRDKGQALESAIASTSKVGAAPLKSSGPIIANMKRRKRVDSDDDEPLPPPKRFIGPLLPPHLIVERTKAQAETDPQAALLKRKIAEKQQLPSAPPSPSKPSPALQSLSQYADDSEESDDDDDMGEKVDQTGPSATPAAPTTSPVSSPQVKSATTTSDPPRAPPTVTPIPAASFYGAPPDKQRKTPEPEEQSSEARYARSPVVHSPRKFGHKRYMGNPFNRLSGSNNLRGGASPMVQNRYGKKNNRNFNRRRP